MGIIRAPLYRGVAISLGQPAENVLADETDVSCKRVRRGRRGGRRGLRRYGQRHRKRRCNCRGSDTEAMNLHDDLPFLVDECLEKNVSELKAQPARYDQGCR